MGGIGKIAEIGDLQNHRLHADGIGFQCAAAHSMVRSRHLDDGHLLNRTESCATPGEHRSTVGAN